MPPPLRRHLFASEHIAIGDYLCREGRCACGREEHNTVSTIAFVCRGVFVKHLPERGHQVIADPSRAIFFWAHQPYRISHPEHAGDLCRTFAPAPNILREALGEFDPGAADRPDAIPAITDAPADARIFRRQAVLARHLLAGDASSLAVDETSCELIRDLLAAAYADRGLGSGHRRRPDTTSAHRDLAAAARLTLSGRWRETLSLADLARAVHASPYHLSRVFRAATGITLQRHVNRLRLREALARLMDGATDLTRIALATGFYDHSHFANAFRREFGSPPSSWRGSLREADAHLSNLIQE
jgi:AraC family transcriptional regulator